VGNENGKTKKKTFPEVLSAPTKKQAGRTPVAPGADQRRPSSVHSRVQFFFKKKMKKFSFQEGKKKVLAVFDVSVLAQPLLLHRPCPSSANCGRVSVGQPAMSITHSLLYGRQLAMACGHTTLPQRKKAKECFLTFLFLEGRVLSVCHQQVVRPTATRLLPLRRPASAEGMLVFFFALVIYSV